MKKIYRQVAVNLILIFISAGVIIFGEICKGSSLSNWKQFLGSDIMFVLISSLLSMLGWRFAEHIVGSVAWDVFMCVVMIFFCMEYGVAMIDTNDAVVKCISISCLLFCLFYFIENFMVILHFKRQLKRMNRLGYQNK